MEMYVIVLERRVTSQAASGFKMYLNFVNMPQWIKRALIEVITFHQFVIIV